MGILKKIKKSVKKISKVAKVVMKNPLVNTAFSAMATTIPGGSIALSGINQLTSMNAKGMIKTAGKTLQQINPQGASKSQLPKGFLPQTSVQTSSGGGIIESILSIFGL